MDTAYNRRVSSINDAINWRAARHAPAQFVGRGFGSDSGLNTQYNDVMRGAANHPRALSQAEKEYRMEGGMSSFGGAWYDDLAQGFRYTPIGMMSDAISGRDTVLSGRAMSGGASATDVGVTMPYREVPMAGVIDHAISGSGKPKFPLATKVQVGNMDGSGKPQVEAAWYENMDDFKSGRNRMKDSKKVGKMTKDPELLASGGRDFTADELKFVEDLLSKGGAGYYGGAWYNDWGDFKEAISEAYDTVKGVWEDYIKPVLDVVGTPLKDALVSSGNPYGEAAGGVLELLGYGDASSGGGIGGGIGGVYGAPHGHSGGRRPKLVKGSPEAKAFMASLRAKRGAKGGVMSGVFADAKPVPANSLGFSPKLEVEQLNAATGSTSYGDMPTSNPVGSGIGGRRKRIIVPKNSRGASSAPSKMGEAEGGITWEEIRAMGSAALENVIRPAVSALANAIVSGAVATPAAVASAARGVKKVYNRDDVQTILRFVKDNPSILIPYLPAKYAVASVVALLLKAYLSVPDIPTREEDDVVVVGRGEEGKMKKSMFEEAIMKMTPSEMVAFKSGGRKISRKTTKKEREGLAISGDNSMGAIVAERGYSKKAQKKSGAVVEAKDDIWEGKQFDNRTGRSGTKNPSLVLEGGAMSGGRQLIQTNNLQAVYGGSGAKAGKSNSFGSLVAKVMKEQGLKLGEATKYIKANNLYKK